MSDEKQLLTDELAEKLVQLIAKYHTGKLRRKQIRQRLFAIRRGKADIADGLKEVIEVQLDRNKQQNWQTFTFMWDVAPDDPFKVIIKEQWIKFGGRYDELGNCDPPAFTKQDV